jgi:glycosyltransferase involved in cell wall biosynthesis
LKLSIITINLNNSAGLIRTINSVINQTSRDFEYIIIDGGSTDGSVEVIKSFTNIRPGIYSEVNKEYSIPYDPAQTTKGVQPDKPCAMPITYWISEPDSGIYNAMNKGIIIARGEYCQFLNSGDWLAAPEVIEKMLKNIPDCSIYYGNMVKQMPYGGILRNKEIPVNSFLTFYSGTLNHSPAFIKRCLFSKYGLYDENLKIVSDWKFFLISIALSSEKVCYCDLDVTCFNMKGISNIEKELNVTERKIVLQKMIPTSILTDYEKYSEYIVKFKRINRFKITRWLVWFIERLLFKMEKIETRFLKEHIVY